jgi:hypothetical protein
VLKFIQTEVREKAALMMARRKLEVSITKMAGLTAAGIALAYGADGLFNHGEDMVKPTGHWIVNNIPGSIEKGYDWIDRKLNGTLPAAPTESTPGYLAASWLEADRSATTVPPVYPGSIAVAHLVNALT